MAAEQAIEHQPDGTLVLRLAPRNDCAAPLVIYVSADSAEVTLDVGRASTYETFLTGWRNTTLGYEDEVTALISAVIAGGFEEHLLVVPSTGEVARAFGRAVVQGVSIDCYRGGTRKVRRRDLEERHFCYCAWFPDARVELFPQFDATS